MDEEEAVKIFDLVVKDGRLPAKLEKLIPLSFIGQAAVAFYRAKIKAMEQLGMAEEQRKATLTDGQDAGHMLLDIETRIGELLPSPEEGRKRGGDRTAGLRRGEDLPGAHPGLDDRRAHAARLIAGHPEARAAVEKEAEENEDIPTKTAVLNRIRYDSEKKRNAIIRAKDKLDMTVAGLEYQSKLMRIVDILPSRPPRDMNDSDFRAIKALVNIIFKRLEAFRDVRKEIEH